MTDIIKPSIIKREKLSEEHYFQSLMQLAAEMKLLTGEDMEHIQLQAVELLAKQTERFTSGDSSSIRIETAQSLMLSVFYIIGVYLKSLPDIDMSINRLKETSLIELFKEGMIIVNNMVKNVGDLFESVKKGRIKTINQAYNDTLDSGIPPFFNSYDIEFGAHDSAGSIDYPLSVDKMDLVGVEYIYSYLEKLDYENRFCQNFSHVKIHRLLTSYSKNYKDLLINIFDFVLINSLGCIICSKSFQLLSVSSEECNYLQRSIQSISKEELDMLLLKASSKLINELDISDTPLMEYIKTATINASPRIKNAAKNNTLNTVFIHLKEDDIEPAINYVDGIKLEDELFRKIADEIRECQFITDKIKIIQNNIRSIEDLADILDSSCIYNDEFYEIYKTIGKMELALLLKRILANAGDLELDAIDAKREWEIKLIKYIKALTPEQRKHITMLYESIDIQ